jgi:hypothetical protein
MIAFGVSIQVFSDHASLQELTSLFGVQPSSGSFDKGTPSRTGPVMRTVWRLDSRVSDGEPIEVHLRDLVSQLPPNRMRAVPLPPGSSFEIAIAAYFDEATVPVTISTHALQTIAEYGAALRFDLYPCEPLATE